MSRIVFLDCETTSLDDETGEVWEIGAIVRNPGQADAEHSWEIRPTLANADPMSLAINRYYERRVLDEHEPGTAAELVSPLVTESGGAPVRPSARRVALKLAEWLNGAVVVGSNPGFDHRFLRPFLRRYHECWTAHYHPVDIQSLAAGWLYGKAAELKKAQPEVDWDWHLLTVAALPWKSADLYKAVGVDPAKYDAHTALGDARLVRDVYDAITGGSR